MTPNGSDPPCNYWSYIKSSFILFPSFSTLEPQGSGPVEPETFVCTNVFLHIIMILHSKNCNISISGSWLRGIFFCIHLIALFYTFWRINFICTNLISSSQGPPLPYVWFHCIGQLKDKINMWKSCNMFRFKFVGQFKDTVFKENNNMWKFVI